MQNQTLGRRPKYAVGSVDSTLQLLQALRDEGELRVQDAAARLGVAPSTAHRLLAMLVFRGFAVQDETRVYRPGRGMNVPPVRSGIGREVRERTRALFREFVADTGETTNLVVRFGSTVRFLETYVAENEFVVSSRRGLILPARRASGGKILLAALDEASLERLYRSEAARLSGEWMPMREFRAFSTELAEARLRGYAINREETESGLCAVSMQLTTPVGATWLAYSVAIPAERFDEVVSADFLETCRRFRDRADVELARPAAQS